MRRVSFWPAFLLGVVTTTGCMQQYPPTPDQPHATIEFRRSYAFHAGSFFYERLVVNGTLAFEASDNSISAEKHRTDSVLLRPGQHELEVSVSFAHKVKQVVQELVDCGSYDAPQECRGPKSREDVVVDATCQQRLGLDVQAGQLYVLQLDFQDAKHCSVQCFVQSLAGNGDLKGVPCPVVPVEE